MNSSISAVKKYFGDASVDNLYFCITANDALEADESSTFILTEKGWKTFGKPYRTVISYDSYELTAEEMAKEFENLQKYGFFDEDVDVKELT